MAFVIKEVFMRKRILSLFLVAVFLASSAGTAFVYAPAKESWQSFAAIDVGKILEEGEYSSSGETVTWQGLTFISADLRAMNGKLAAARAKADINYTITRGGLEYRYINSNVFYSKGPQHVLGRITLNPGQTGSFGLGSSFSIESSVSSGISLEIFEINVSNSYMQTYTVSYNFELTNTTDYLRTAALGCVFMIHRYDIYEDGEYTGYGQVYEPFSAYTYWIN